MVIRTIVVDDLPLAREGICLRLRGHQDFKVIGEAGSGSEALELITRLTPDLVFLDVQMPDLDGFEVLERASRTHLPAVIFVTAHDRYAVRAFETHALHFLLKPITEKLFQESLDRARRELSRENEREDGTRRLAALFDSRRPTGSPDLPDAASDQPGYLLRLVVRDRDRFLLLKADEIEWIESARNYARVHARDRTFMVRMTMNELEGRLDPRHFARVHRATIVNINQVDEIRASTDDDLRVNLKTGVSVRLSRRYRGTLIP